MSNPITIGDTINKLIDNVNTNSSDMSGHINDKVSHITEVERDRWNKAEENVQSDWSVTDNTSDAYIKNKPESLPANGGNADTIDGLHASSFRQITKYEPQITTLPTPTSEIDYCVWGGDSTFPYPYGNLSIRYGSHGAEHIAMYYTTGDDRDVWYNVAFSGTWMGWRRLCGQLSPIVVPEGTSTNTCTGEPGKIVPYICTGTGFVDLPPQALLDYAGGISTAQGTIIAYNFNGKGVAGQDVMWCKQVFISAHFGRTFTRYIDSTVIGEWNYEDTKQQNPNLLINPDFKINQRGQSSYTGAVYGVDRWKGVYGAEVVTVADDGIELNVGNNQQIGQYIEISIPAGTMLTYSSYSEYVGTVSDDSYRSFYVLGKKNDGTWELFITFGDGNGDKSATYQSQSGAALNDYTMLQVLIGANGVIKIHNVKLEFGPIATPFVPPDPSLELLKCQRYYTKGEYAFDKTTKNANYAIVNVQFPVKMRTTPTVTIYSMNGTVNTISEWASHNDALESVSANSGDLDVSGFTSITSVNSFVENEAYKFKYTADAEIY